MDDMTAVSLGLFAAWAAHDAEEWLTMARNSAGVLARASEVIPLPHGLSERGVSQDHVNLSLTIMAGIVGTASLRGVLTGGKSAFFRGGLLAFGLHGFTHLGASVLARGYTTGVVTAPVIVIPYWLWASGKLRNEGIRLLDRGAIVSAISAIPLLIGTHLAAASVLKEKSIGREKAGLPR